MSKHKDLRYSVTDAYHYTTGFSWRCARHYDGRLTEKGHISMMVCAVDLGSLVEVYNDRDIFPEIKWNKIWNSIKRACGDEV